MMYGVDVAFYGLWFLHGVRVTTAVMAQFSAERHVYVPRYVVLVTVCLGHGRQVLVWREICEIVGWRIACVPRCGYIVLGYQPLVSLRTRLLCNVHNLNVFVSYFSRGATTALGVFSGCLFVFIAKRKLGR